MGMTDLGSLSVGGIVPAAVSASAAIKIACGIAAPNVSAQISAMVGFTPKLAFSFADQLSVALQIVNDLQIAIAVGLPALSLSAQVSLGVSVSATLNANLTLIQAQLDVSLALDLELAAAGVRLLTYAGAQNAMGSALTTALGSDATAVNGLVLVATSPAAWAAMQTVFKTS
jgi:hypothetical protein